MADISYQYPCPKSVLSQVICFLNIPIEHYINNLFICFLVAIQAGLIQMLIHTFPGAVCVIAVWCSQVGQSPAEIRLHSKSPKSMKTVHNNNKFLALPNMDRKCLRDPCVTKWNLVIFNWINHKHHNLFPQIVIKIFFWKWLYIIIIKYP